MNDPQENIGAAVQREAGGWSQNASETNCPMSPRRGENSCTQPARLFNYTTKYIFFLAWENLAFQCL